MEGRRFSSVLRDDFFGLDTNTLEIQRVYNRMINSISHKKSLIVNFRPEEHMKNVTFAYEIFAVYGETPESPLVFRPKDAISFGRDDEEAKLRSGIYKILDVAKKEPTTEKLDPRYITIICREIGPVKVKDE